MSDQIPPSSSELPIIRTDANNVSNSPVIPSAVPAAQSAEPRLLFNPSIDIYETTDGLVLYADLPGVTVEGLELQVQDNRLTLYGRVSKKEPEGSQLLHEEYQVGDFLRSFILSDEVDHERIQAKLTNGLLRVELPRAPRSKPRRIEVSRE
ncbi:MAG: Hsp20/alpha crystallin family protein [Planctomyces sp.]|nr:Hsp20/alpha crystallin family protein [Planctomyces sp.]